MPQGDALLRLVRACSEFPTAVRSLHDLRAFADALCDQHFAGCSDNVSLTESVFVPSLLLSTALRGGHVLHDRLHSDLNPHGCGFRSESTVWSCWSEFEAEPFHGFRKWAEMYVIAFAATHSERIPSMLARRIDSDPGLPVSVRSIANEFELSQHTLLTIFKAEFGVSIKRYQLNARMAAATRLLQLTDTKIEAIALSVGYKSKKSFYKIVRNTTGQTPAEIRKRQPQSAEHSAAS